MYSTKAWSLNVELSKSKSRSDLPMCPSQCEMRLAIDAGLDIMKHIENETIKLELLLVGWKFVDKRWQGVGPSKPVLWTRRVASIRETTATTKHLQKRNRRAVQHRLLFLSKIIMGKSQEQEKIRYDKTSWWNKFVGKSNRLLALRCTTENNSYGVLFCVLNK